MQPGHRPIEEQTTELGTQGYPLRQEALVEPFPAAGSEAAAEHVSVPPDPGPRRRVPGWWMPVASVLILVAGLGTAYAVTQERAPRARAAGNTPTAPSATTAAAAPAHSVAATTPVASPPTAATPTPPASAPPPARTTVPTVIGHALPEAVKLLRQAGLTAIVTHVSSTKAAGQVLSQRPGEGTKEPKGARVLLDVSVPRPVVVPDVVGMTGLAARKRLESQQLLVSLRYVPSTERARTVVAQFPRAGTTLKPGAHVLINLSTGTRPSSSPSSSGSNSPGSSTATVPDVVGEDEATAVADLESAGFSVDTVNESTNDPGEDGIVLDQDPNGGADASDGSSVTVHVGRYSGG